MIGRPAPAAAVFSCPIVCYCTATGSLDGRRHFSPAGTAARGFFVLAEVDQSAFPDDTSRRDRLAVVRRQVGSLSVVSSQSV